jgi:hypothetical protein
MRAEAAALLALLLAAPAAAQLLPQPKPAPAPAGPVESGHAVEGFRSAGFGMTEQQVRAAIRKDFGLSGDKVAAEENPVERTTVLAVAVPDLLPDAGPARISYILGFKSKRLIQVNLLWGTPLGETAPEKLRAAGTALAQYFKGLDWPAESVIANARLNDGSWVLFQGADARKRTVVLRFDAGEGEKEGERKSAVMTLFYIADPENPDVFRIRPGQF